MLEKEFGFKIAQLDEQKLADILGPLYGDNQFENIVKFMSGRAPSEIDPGQLKQPGTERCIALIYEGVEAVRKIRDVLGPTDPSKAPPGSIRREFGQTVMVNAAHASDSPESAQREMKIVNVGENTFKQVVEEFYGR
jgi:nucleoside diphosphate kinase